MIQYLNGEKQFQQIASTEAKEVNVKSDARTLTAEFTGLGGLDLAATVTVRLADGDPLSYWSISIRNHANLIDYRRAVPLRRNALSFGREAGFQWSARLGFLAAVVV